MPVLQESNVKAQKGELLERLAHARAQSDALFGIVKPEALYDRPIAERHRIVFYIGHLEAFDWNLLHERVLGEESFEQKLDRLFAFGIDPVDGGLPSDQPSDWPSMETVRRYVSDVRGRVDKGLAKAEFAESNDAGTLLNVAIEHRLMHAETLAYMLHQLPHDRKVRPVGGAHITNVPVVPEMIAVPAGRVTLGLSRDSGEFGWDNEFEAHVVEVPAFEIDKFKVTNGQYLDFISAGGYENAALWKPEDWQWRTKQNVEHPVFWKKTENSWFYNTMFEAVPLPLDWPVYVSHAEACAYARWAGKALPTEAQWQRAAYGTESSERRYPWGGEAPEAAKGNFDFRSWDPAPVGAFPEGNSYFDVSGMLGNGWEWTSTTFQSFPGFKAFPFYPGYSADFFDGKHYVMKGASARTAACMLRPTFRNWFQSHYQFVYAGFRCVSN